jgi:DNA repair protein RecO
MYYCDKGIVLRHRDVNEADVIASIFTLRYGRLEVNFRSARKSAAKLRPLTELFCYGDYRFYLKKYGAMPLCIGGGIISFYTEMRNNLEKMMMFSIISDIVLSLTPVYQSSEDKFNLILSSLDYLNSTESVSKWFVIVFIMNFLEYYGAGFKMTNIGYESELWDLIHRPDFSSIYRLDEYEDLYDDLLDFATSKLLEHSNRNFQIRSALKYNNLASQL